jgi:hypothetical protein
MEQAEFDADLGDRRRRHTARRGQAEVVEAALRAVQEREPVLARPHVEERVRPAVHQTVVAEELRRPGEGVAELALAGEVLVLDHEQAGTKSGVAIPAQPCFGTLTGRYRIALPPTRCATEPLTGP